MGEEAWRDFPSWPPPGYQPARYYLQPDGGLSSQPPGESAPDAYRYDPADPTPAVGGVLMSRSGGRVDNTKLEARPDVLSYTTARLDSDIEVIGEVSAEIWFRSSLRHADVFVRLCDVDPGGRSRNVCDGLVSLSGGRRAELRHGAAVADRAPVPGRPPDQGPGLQRRVPALRPQPGHRRTFAERHYVAGRRPGGSSRPRARIGSVAPGRLTARKWRECRWRGWIGGCGCGRGWSGSRPRSPERARPTSSCCSPGTRRATRSPTTSSARWPAECRCRTGPSQGRAGNSRYVSTARPARLGRTRGRWCSTFTAAGSCSVTCGCATGCAATWRCGWAPSWCRWTTGSRRGTGSRPPWRTATRPWCGPPSTPPGWARAARSG